MNKKHKTRLITKLDTEHTKQMMIMASMLRLAKVYKCSEVVIGTIMAGAVVLMALMAVELVVIELLVVELLVVELIVFRGYQSEYANHVISEVQIAHLYQVRHVSTKLVVVTLETQVIIIAASAPKSKLLALIRTVGTFWKAVGKVTTAEIDFSPQLQHMQLLDGMEVVPLLKAQENVSNSISMRDKRYIRVGIIIQMDN